MHSNLVYKCDSFKVASCIDHDSQFISAEICLHALEAIVCLVGLIEFPRLLFELSVSMLCKHYPLLEPMGDNQGACEVVCLLKPSIAGCCNHNFHLLAEFQTN